MIPANPNADDDCPRCKPGTWCPARVAAGLVALQSGARPKIEPGARWADWRTSWGLRLGGGHPGGHPGFFRAAPRQRLTGPHPDDMILSLSFRIAIQPEASGCLPRAVYSPLHWAAPRVEYPEHFSYQGSRSGAKGRWAVIEFKCRKCGAEMESPEILAGKADRCPQCKVLNRVPGPPGTMSDAVEAAEPESPDTATAASTEQAVIVFKCRRCGAEITSPAQKAGWTGKCASCGELQRVPLLSVQVPAPPKPQDPVTVITNEAGQDIIIFPCKGCGTDVRACVGRQASQCGRCGLLQRVPVPTIRFKVAGPTEAAPVVAAEPDPATEQAAAALAADYAEFKPARVLWVCMGCHQRFEPLCSGEANFNCPHCGLPTKPEFLAWVLRRRLKLRKLKQQPGLDDVIGNADEDQEELMLGVKGVVNHKGRTVYYRTEDGFTHSTKEDAIAHQNRFLIDKAAAARKAAAKQAGKRRGTCCRCGKAPRSLTQTDDCQWVCQNCYRELYPALATENKIWNLRRLGFTVPDDLSEKEGRRLWLLYLARLTGHNLPDDIPLAELLRMDSETSFLDLAQPIFAAEHERHVVEEIERRSQFLPPVRHFFTKVAGVSFKNDDGSDRQEILSTCSPLQTLRLEHEENNPYDSNAISVCTEDGRQIGHLFRDVAADVWWRMQHNFTYAAISANITGGTKGQPERGMNILLLVARPGVPQEEIESYLQSIMPDVEADVFEGSSDEDEDEEEDEDDDGPGDKVPIFQRRCQDKPPLEIIRTKVCGVSKKNEDGSRRQEIIAQCWFDEDLDLVREPDNPHDEDAIAVFRASFTEQCGYLPARLASKIAPLMDSGVNVTAGVFDVTGGDDGLPFGLIIQVEIPEG